MFENYIGVFENEVIIQKISWNTSEYYQFLLQEQTIITWIQFLE